VTQRSLSGISVAVCQIPLPD